jgi:hypothetical protein
MRKQYDFSDGVTGKYASRFGEPGLSVKLDSDVAREFPTAKAVNDALRGLIKTSKPKSIKRS